MNNLLQLPKYGIKTFSVCCLSIFLLACQSTPGNKEPFVQEEQDSPKQAKIKEQALLQEQRAEDVLSSDKLYPLALLLPESNNVYQKYGIEFSGVCYACDLAKIKITARSIQLINVCDDKDVTTIPKLNAVIDGDKITIKTGQQLLIITKIDKAPIYQLEIKGDQLSSDNKRILKYYTPEKLIKKFEQHDCGDFQG
ncbi:MAG: hypothetical protein BGO31_12355 [Bacteroidetes bacterium 43-16]|nr:MAG: hypothetical protein BGO31_12355 [Bacteroidetes bacterium 43-16]